MAGTLRQEIEFPVPKQRQGLVCTATYPTRSSRRSQVTVLARTCCMSLSRGKLFSLPFPSPSSQGGHHWRLSRRRRKQPGGLFSFTFDNNNNNNNNKKERTALGRCAPPPTESPLGTLNKIPRGPRSPWWVRSP